MGLKCPVENIVSDLIRPYWDCWHIYVPEGCIFHDLLFYMYMYVCVCVCVCVDLSDDGFECGEEESLPKTAFQSKRFEVVLF